MHYILYNYKKLFRMFEHTEIFAWNCVQKYCERLSRRIEIYEARRAGLSVNWQLEIVALYQKCASRYCEREGDWHLCERKKKKWKRKYESEKRRRKWFRCSSMTSGSLRQRCLSTTLTQNISIVIVFSSRRFNWKSLMSG